MNPDRASPDRYLVLGNPIAHSRSPQIQARFAELTGQPVDYQPLLVPHGEFASALASLVASGVRGCNVTVPFKFEACRLASSRSDRAQLAQAANTLVLQPGGAVHADNTDGIGLVSDIRHNAGVALAGSDVLLIGAGGAAAGVLGPLLAAGPRRLVLVNRTLAHAEALALAHRAHPSLQQVLRTSELLVAPIDRVPGSFGIVINASASSLAGNTVPVASQVLQPGALAVDLMYGPAAQPFLDWARAAGAVPCDGLGMLVEQAAEAFLLWRGVRPPSARVLAELRRAAP